MVKKYCVQLVKILALSPSLGHENLVGSCPIMNKIRIVKRLFKGTLVLLKEGVKVDGETVCWVTQAAEDKRFPCVDRDR